VKNPERFEDICLNIRYDIQSKLCVNEMDQSILYPQVNYLVHRWRTNECFFYRIFGNVKKISLVEVKLKICDVFSIWAMPKLNIHQIFLSYSNGTKRAFTLLLRSTFQTTCIETVERESSSFVSIDNDERFVCSSFDLVRIYLSTDIELVSYRDSLLSSFVENITMNST
jgi:hypothetical protein